jgi:hypothetical protein
VTKVFSVLAPAASATKLVQELQGMTGVEPSDPTDWSGGSTAFDAPFNIRRRDRAFRLVRILVHDEDDVDPLSVVIADVPEVHVLTEPRAEPVEIRSASDVREAMGRAPRLG